MSPYAYQTATITTSTTSTFYPISSGTGGSGSVTIPLSSLVKMFWVTNNFGSIVNGVSLDSVMAYLKQMPQVDMDNFIRRILSERYFADDDDSCPIDRSKEAHQGFQLPHGTYALPDGATLTINDDTSYQFCDKDAKVTYAANRNREFNEYVNVSDILDQFMQYASAMKLTRDQFLTIPIQTFLKWLIIEASRKDGETVPDHEVKQLELELSA
jgi:hypothetical protein